MQEDVSVVESGSTHREVTANRPYIAIKTKNRKQAY
jgi:hypothetical protein